MYVILMQETRYIHRIREKWRAGEGAVSATRAGAGPSRVGATKRRTMVPWLAVGALAAAASAAAAPLKPHVLFVLVDGKSSH